ncbi:MAG TPA: hypothetical protein VF303_02805 [Candidatus Nanoarchaeia archaeon]
MDKKTLSTGLIVLSVIAAVLGALDYLADYSVLGLGADSWIVVAAALGIYAIYTKVA